jgi:hypothetical protein
MIMPRTRSHSGARIDDRHGSHTLTSPAGVQETGCGTLERTIGWVGNFRRLTVRSDRLLATYGGFFHLACALLVLRREMISSPNAPSAPCCG